MTYINVTDLVETLGSSCNSTGKYSWRMYLYYSLYQEDHFYVLPLL